MRKFNVLHGCVFALFVAACQPAAEQQESTADTTITSRKTIDAVNLAAYFPDTLLNRFQQDIDAYQQQDGLTPPPEDAALFVGSSSLRMWDSLQQDMAPVPVINRGFGGSTLPEVLHYFDKLVLPYQPKVILVYAGENDLVMQEAAISPQIVQEMFEIFVNTVKAKLPGTEKIYFIAIKPSVSRWQQWPAMQQANTLVAQYARQEEEVTFIDVTGGMMNGDQVKTDIFLEDNLHMNRKGYAIWTDKIKPLLLQDFNLEAK